MSVFKLFSLIFMCDKTPIRPCHLISKENLPLPPSEKSDTLKKDQVCVVQMRERSPTAR